MLIIELLEGIIEAGIGKQKAQRVLWMPGFEKSLEKTANNDVGRIEAIKKELQAVFNVKHDDNILQPYNAKDYKFGTNSSKITFWHTHLTGNTLGRNNPVVLMYGIRGNDLIYYRLVRHDITQNTKMQTNNLIQLISRLDTDKAIIWLDATKEMSMAADMDTYRPEISTDYSPDPAINDPKKPLYKLSQIEKGIVQARERTRSRKAKKRSLFR